VWVKEILYLLFLTFSLISLISILEHRFVGIQSPEIMADSTEAKQVLVGRHQASNRQMTLRNAGWEPVYLRAASLCHCGHIWKKCCYLGHRGESMREAGMIRFVRTAIFSGVEQLFLERKAIASGTLNPESTHDSFRRFAICFYEPWGSAD